MYLIIMHYNAPYFHTKRMLRGPLIVPMTVRYVSGFTTINIIQSKLNTVVFDVKQVSLE